MANPSYLMKRNGVYYARIPIPALLQKELGKKEVWKSLGNRSYKEACELLKYFLLSKTLLMPDEIHKTVLLTSPLAMEAIGERQYETTRNFYAAQYLQYANLFGAIPSKRVC